MRRESVSRTRSMLGLVAAAALMMAPLQAAQAGGKDPGVHENRTVNVQGIERTFSYFVPPGAGDKPLPMVIYLHGHGDSMRHMLGHGFLASPASRWMDVAKRERFLVFYPLGMKKPGRRSKTGWNDCRADAEGNPDVDDVAFLRRLIDFAHAELGADRKRVYVTGMSNGGHMTMRAAMEMSDAVAAAASLVALLPKKNKCKPPPRPVPILLMHGTEDPIAPFQGGSMAGGRGLVYSARETVGMWVRWNGLDGVKESSTTLQDSTPDDNSHIVKHTREASASGNSVVAYEVVGGGHTEPSRKEKVGRLVQRFSGKQNQDVEMAEVIWDFFRTRSR